VPAPQDDGQQENRRPGGGDFFRDAIDYFAVPVVIFGASIFSTAVSLPPI
jgi:hypothetical protein